MAINASLTGRLRNTTLPKSHALLPLYEAVVNAIQSVDAANADMGLSEIDVQVVRSPQLTIPVGSASFGPTPLDPIQSFVVSDNGEGFHDGNMKSFETLDSEYKAVAGGRGVGRLMWLKAFEKVAIESDYIDSSGHLGHRTFRFTAEEGVSRQVQSPSEASHSGASVQLSSFKEEYRESAPKTLAAIARSVLEHCLWYFVRPGGAPNIVVRDELEAVDLHDAFTDYMLASSQAEDIIIQGVGFELVHLRLKANSKAAPQLNWCASNRVVVAEGIAGKIPGLYGKLRDADSEFMYACFLTSSFLDANVRAERTHFDIQESTEGTFDEEELSLAKIRTAVLASSEAYLKASLIKTVSASRERVRSFVDNKAPRYRPILRHIDESKMIVDPGVSDRELELQLHRSLADLEGQLLVEGQEILNASSSLPEGYDERLQVYLERVDDIKKSDLAAYVSRRRVILDLLEQAIRVGEDNKYAREDVIHSLIMPMRTTSDEVHPSVSNLWVIDEGLAFHNYLASDKPLKTMPISDTGSRTEPDIIALKVNDGPVLVAEGEGRSVPLASVTVIEIKRPMRNDASGDTEKDPLAQALRYLERVREGTVKTASGRPIPNSDHVPGFCYVIADLTPSVRERCKAANLRPTQDGLGFFGYNDNYKAYIEVISFDRLLNMAHQRNRSFFDQLGLPVG
ncbi:ATP-binding protein [Geodermatophilaceae bacterium NBWT11]|nr:ATP-binding protein [Geodermatophilaceae bacterium NBWT11]